MPVNKTFDPFIREFVQKTFFQVLFVLIEILVDLWLPVNTSL